MLAEWLCGMLLNFNDAKDIKLGGLLSDVWVMWISYSITEFALFGMAAETQALTSSSILVLVCTYLHVLIVVSEHIGII